MIDYTHPRRAGAALVAAPVAPRTTLVTLQRGETIILTGPRAGTIERR